MSTTNIGDIQVGSKGFPLHQRQHTLRSHEYLASGFKSGYREDGRALQGSPGPFQAAGPQWGRPSETFCLSVTFKVASLIKQPAW